MHRSAQVRWKHKLVMALVGGMVAVCAPSPSRGVCIGDCDAGATVTVDELIVMVNIALETLQLNVCPVGDANGDARITIEEIITAATFALDSCPVPTPTPTPGSIAEELAATGLGQYLGTMPTLMRRNGDWEEYFYDPANGPVCLRGGTYQVNLRRGSSNKVILYLEGGGACWNYSTCWLSPLAKLEAGSAFAGGFLDAQNPNNPLRDWNVVYASYCDGSVFAGDKDTDYRGHLTYHHGLRNLSAAVSLLQREFPHPEEILVSGSSAGGFGTYTGYGLTRVAFPETPMLVFNDSGPGLQNPDDPQTAAERAANWNFLQFIPPTCTECSIQLIYLTSWALDRDPTLRGSYFSYQQDAVLRFFLSFGAEEFQSVLLSTSGVLQARHPDRLKRFFPIGETHTTLLSPGFYTESINGTTVRDWTADFLVNGPKWQDLVAESE